MELFHSGFLLFIFILKGGELMLGIPDAGIWLAYLLCIASTILCVVYGIINWNKGENTDEGSSQKDIEWDKKENEIDSKL